MVTADYLPARAAEPVLLAVLRAVEAAPDTQQHRLRVELVR